SDVFLGNVNDEQCAWQTGQLGDRAQVLLHLLALAGNLQALALAQVLEGAVDLHAVDGGHLLDGTADGAEVGEHTTAPTLSNEGHAGRLHLLSNDVLSLLLGGHEEDLLATASDVLHGSSGLLQLHAGLVEVNDV